MTEMSGAPFPRTQADAQRVRTRENQQAAAVVGTTAISGGMMHAIRRWGPAGGGGRSGYGRPSMISPGYRTLAGIFRRPGLSAVSTGVTALHLWGLHRAIGSQRGRQVVRERAREAAENAAEVVSAGSVAGGQDRSERADAGMSFIGRLGQHLAQSGRAAMEYQTERANQGVQSTRDIGSAVGPTLRSIAESPSLELGRRSIVDNPHG